MSLIMKRLVALLVLPAVIAAPMASGGVLEMTHAVSTSEN